MKNILQRIEITTRVVAYAVTVGLVVLTIVTWPTVKLIPMMFQMGRGLGKAMMESVDSFDREAQPWEETSMSLPEGHGKLTFIRRQAHPMLVEYDQRLSFPSPAGTNITVDLPMNTGGQTAVNVYWYPKTLDGGPSVRIQDKFVECVIDLHDGTALQLHRYEGKVYQAPLSGSGSRSITLIEGKEAVVTLGEHTAQVTTGVFTTDNGAYLGRFDGNRSSYGFLPVIEQPEEKIDTM
jgi:hypothetical protein